jgi:hypothetical protein
LAGDLARAAGLFGGAKVDPPRVEVVRTRLGVEGDFNAVPRVDVILPEESAVVADAEADAVKPPRVEVAFTVLVLCVAGRVAGILLLGGVEVDDGIPVLCCVAI